MTEKILYIVRGVPGSGKSTFALENAKKWESQGSDASVFEADMFMVQDGVYKFDPNKLQYAHMMCQRCVNTAMMDGVRNIFVANTFIKKWEADIYYALAQVWGYRVVVYRMDNSFNNIHGVSQDKVNIMRANMESYPGEICLWRKQCE